MPPRPCATSDSLRRLRADRPLRRWYRDISGSGGHTPELARRASRGADASITRASLCSPVNPQLAADESRRRDREGPDEGRTRAGRYSSGQRGQTVNLMAQPSQVRILLSPPSSQAAGHRAALNGLPHFPRRIFPALVSCPPPLRRQPRLPSPPPKLKLRANLRAQFTACGRSSMVERQPSKLHTWVRFPSPAPQSSRRNGRLTAAAAAVAQW